MKRKTITMILAILAFLLALGLTLYPMIAAKYNASHQSAIHADYEQILDKTDDAQKEQALELAHQYNEMLKPGVQEAFSQDLLQWASEDYADQLNIAGNGIMGYVVIPNIQVNLPIFHGTADGTLAKGVGHLLGSSLPVGGIGTHTVLTGHSGMASQKMFSDLPGMKVGDIFYLDVLGERLAYKVQEINTVLPYWTAFNDYAFTKMAFAKNFKKRKPGTDHWMTLSLGSSAYHLDILTLKNRNAVSVELYISDDKSIFQQLFQHKDEIEAEIGFALDWRELPDKKASRILIEKPVNLDDHDEWHSQFDWIIDTCIRFKKTFKKFI